MSEETARVSAGDQERPLPLSTLLSQVLVAFTIELDNEFERQMPHRTTHFASTGAAQQGPWLVSLVMWSNCMRFVGEQGVRVRDLEALARTKTNLNGMSRWGYVVVAPDPADTRAKPPQADWVIRATAKGQQAREVWRPLFGAIERRWELRFGTDAVEGLRTALGAVVSQLDPRLPDCLPILGYGLFSQGPGEQPGAPMGQTIKRDDSDGSDLPLSTLLSRALLAFAIEFERESDLSLAICANVVRVLDASGVRVRDLPRVSGVSKEATSMALGFLQKRRLAVVEPDPAGARAKVARLTATGREAQEAYRHMLLTLEERWHDRWGAERIGALRLALGRLVGDATMAHSPLSVGLQPSRDGWRAAVSQPDTLPHFPMVLHRGGFPDGS